MKDFESQIKETMKRLRKERLVQVDSVWLKKTRDELKQTLRAKRRSASHKSFWFMPFTIRPLATALIITLIVILAGGGTVLASQEADPGDALYSVKLAHEKFNLLVNTSPKAKARLYIKYSDRRLGELERLYEKETGEEWEEKLVQSLGAHSAGTKEQLEALKDLPEYGEMALLFEEMIERHRDRMDIMRKRMSTLRQAQGKHSTSSMKILERARRINELNHDQVLENLERVDERLEKHRKRTQDNQERIDEIHDKVRDRLEDFRKRRGKMRDRLHINEKLNDGQIEVQIQDDGKIEIEIQGESDDKDSETSRIYEDFFEDDGVHIESEIEVEGEGEEDVETEIETEDGQVFFKSRIKASGDSIIINDSSYINASSSQRVIINGEEIEVE